MAIASTMKLIWQNRRHFKLQIFGMMVLLVVCIFITNLVSIKVTYNKKLKNYVMSNTQYTDTFQLSLSGVQGTVDKVYVDSSGKQCFILASLNSTSSIAIDANKYQMFVTNVNADGSNNGKPKEKINGEIYMFGSSGLIGLYLNSDTPFENTMKQLTFRSYMKYTSNTKPYIKTTASDAQYDQCHLYFNPGGTNKKTIDFLENHIPGTQFDLTEIYRQVNTSQDEKTARDEIKQSYDDILATMRKITEYQKRLRETYGIEVPELPDYINGDYFDTVKIYDADGNETGSYRKFVPATIVPGGTEFDWYNGSVASGYFKLIPNIKSSISIRDYIYALNNDKASRAKPDVKINEWYYTDGTPVNTKVKSDGTATTIEIEISNNIENYQTQLETYIKYKTKYQTEQLPNLLLLEFKSGSVGQVYSVRNDENTVVTY